MTIDFLVGIGSQAKTQQTNSSNAYPVLPPVGSKIVALNGKERKIERIKIDDPSALDAEIQKTASNKENMHKLGAVGIAVFALSFIATLVIILAAPFGAFFPVFAAATILQLGSVGAIGWSSQRLIKGKELQSCQKAMRTEEFRTFAKTFGEELPVDELLKVHREFVKEKQDKETFERTKFDLYCRLNKLI